MHIYECVTMPSIYDVRQHTDNNTDAFKIWNVEELVVEFILPEIQD